MIMSITIDYGYDKHDYISKCQDFSRFLIGSIIEIYSVIPLYRLGVYTITTLEVHRKVLTTISTGKKKKKREKTI